MSGLKRCGKSCRLRWLNYLRPNIKHGGFSEEEDNMICNLYINIGSRWSIIAAQLPGRTDNDIKNYWNTRLKKKLLGQQRKEQAISAQARRRANDFAPNQRTNREIFSSCGNPNFNETNAINSHCLRSSFEPYHVTGHAPFWPELPPAMASGLSPDDSSIKNLLVKLEGRFSDGALNYNYQDHPHLLASAHGQTYQAPSFDALASNAYNGESSSGYDQSPVFQLGLESLQAELNELINYSSYQPEDAQLAALNGNYGADNCSEGLYGFEYRVANGSSTVSANSTTTSLESSSSSMANYNSNMVCDYSHNYSSSYFGTSENQVIIDV